MAGTPAKAVLLSDSISHFSSTPTAVADNFQFLIAIPLSPIRGQL
jgi:hypothetical protein